MSSKRELDEQFKIRTQTMMGQRISERDPDYAHYSGAFLDDALEAVNIDHLLRTYQFSPIVTAHLKNRRIYLDLKRKAYFASVRSDIISQLSYILGDTRKVMKWK